MSRVRNCTLTDTRHDVWLDSFVLTGDSLRLPTPHPWSIRKRTLRGGLRDGVDLIEVCNGALSFSILPTRGMGLWRGDYRGNFLGWQAPVIGPVHPKFVDQDNFGGLGWLAGFDEWLCRCGLHSNGPPGNDNGKQLTLHGRIANRPAHFVEVRVDTEPPFEMSVTGQVAEGGLFLPHLRLTATYTTVPGSNRLGIHDVVENCSAQPAEMQLLYHCNVGPPFLEAASRLAAPAREVAPLSQRAAEAIDRYDVYAGPVAGFAEENYGYNLAGDPAGRTLILLQNAAADRALVLRWNLKELPCFLTWKNTGAVQDGYVTGLEPSTNFPNFKSYERQQGRVRVLPPGGRWECTWSIEVLDSQAMVRGALEEVEALQGGNKPVVHRTPQPRYSPA